MIKKTPKYDKHTSNFDSFSASCLASELIVPTQGIMLECRDRLDGLINELECGGICQKSASHYGKKKT